MAFGTNPKDLLNGDDDQMTFLSRGTADGIPANVTLKIVDAARGLIFVRLKPTVLDKSSEITAPTGLVNISVKYYGRENGRRSHWLARPMGRGAAPVLIALRGTLSGSTREISIEALIGGQAPIGCEYDPISLGCRGEK